MSTEHTNGTIATTGGRLGCYHYTPAPPGDKGPGTFIWSTRADQIEPKTPLPADGATVRVLFGGKLNSVEVENVLRRTTGMDRPRVLAAQHLGADADGDPLMLVEVDGRRFKLHFRKTATVHRTLMFTEIASFVVKQGVVTHSPDTNECLLIFKGSAVALVKPGATQVNGSVGTEVHCGRLDEEGSWDVVPNSKPAPGAAVGDRTVYFQSFDDVRVPGAGSKPTNPVVQQEAPFESVRLALERAIAYVETDGAAAVATMVKLTDALVDAAKGGKKGGKGAVLNAGRVAMNVISTFKDMEDFRDLLTPESATALAHRAHRAFGDSVTRANLLVSFGPFNAELGECALEKAGDLLTCPERGFDREGCLRGLTQLLDSDMQEQVQTAMRNMLAAFFLSEGVPFGAEDMTAFVDHTIELAKSFLSMVYGCRDEAARGVETEAAAGSMAGGEEEEDDGLAAFLRRVMDKKPAGNDDDDAAERCDDPADGECKTAAEWARLTRSYKFLTKEDESFSGEGCGRDGCDLTVTAVMSMKGRDLHLVETPDAYSVFSSSSSATKDGDGDGGDGDGDSDGDGHGDGGGGGGGGGDDDDGDDGGGGGGGGVKAKRMRLHYVIPKRDDKVRGLDTKPAFTLHPTPDNREIVATFNGKDTKAAMRAVARRIAQQH